MAKQIHLVGRENQVKSSETRRGERGRLSRSQTGLWIVLCGYSKTCFLQHFDLVVGWLDIWSPYILHNLPVAMWLQSALSLLLLYKPRRSAKSQKASTFTHQTRHWELLRSSFDRRIIDTAATKNAFDQQPASLDKCSIYVHVADIMVGQSPSARINLPLPPSTQHAPNPSSQTYAFSQI